MFNIYDYCLWFERHYCGNNQSDNSFPLVLSPYSVTQTSSFHPTHTTASSLFYWQPLTSADVTRISHTFVLVPLTANTRAGRRWCPVSTSGSWWSKPHVQSHDSFWGSRVTQTFTENETGSVWLLLPLLELHSLWLQIENYSLWIKRLLIVCPYVGVCALCITF